MSYTEFNIVKRTDGYKPTHRPVMPKSTTRVTSYLESRGGEFPYVVVFGHTALVAHFLSGVRVTRELIAKAKKRFLKYYGTKRIMEFNEADWLYIADELGGKLPLRIKAAPEGSVIPTRNVLMTIENTDDRCFWLTNYVESLLLKVWYPYAVATLSRDIKELILKYLVKTGTPETIMWKLHDFGYRGVSSEEAAEIGGGAHLVNFQGSDTIIAVDFIEDYYNFENEAELVAMTIPATEHSVMCSEGPEGEINVIKRFLDTFRDDPVPAIACVSDTYNLWDTIGNKMGKQLKADIVSMNDETGKFLVVRPDSGDPVTIVVQVAETLEESFGCTINAKGYKVLNSVRIIQGDGVNRKSIESILEALTMRGFSTDNIAFGMGGALLQGVNRDTQKYAIKACSYVIDGYVKEYRKDPITDQGKRSKLGKLKLILDDNGVYQTVSLSGADGRGIGYPDQLEVIFENGEMKGTPNFTDIRRRARVTVGDYTL